MVHPVSSGIRRKGKVAHGISVDFVIELEEDAEAGVCKNGMRRFGENVIVGKTFFACRESLGCQVLLDREMRELDYLVASLIDDRDETRAHRHQHFFWIFWTPICIKCRGLCLIEL